MVLRIWNLAAEKQPITLNSRDTGLVLFSPDGRQVATSLGNAVGIWDVATGQRLAFLRGLDGVQAMDYSPDGARLVTAGWERDARLWDPHTGEQIAVLKGHKGDIFSARFSPDGKSIVTGSWDSTARVWDAADGRATVALKGHMKAVNDAIFSPDGSRIVTASHDLTARVWNATRGHEISVLSGHTARVTKAAYSPDGSQIATASDDASALLWDSQSGEQQARLQHEDWVTAVEFSSDGTCVLTGSKDQTAKLWNARSAKLITALDGHSAPLVSATFNGNGTQVLTSALDGSAILWGARTGAPIRGFSDLEGAACAAISSDGTWVATSSSRILAKGGHDNDPLKVPDLQQQAPLTTASTKAAKGDIVDCSVFAPHSAPSGANILVQVFLHRAEHGEMVVSRALSADPQSALKGSQTLAIEIAPASTVHLHLDGRGMKVDEPMQSLVWRRDPVVATFTLNVPAHPSAAAYYPVVSVIVDARPVGRLVFKLSVDDDAEASETQLNSLHARKYDLAFLSYSSQDRSEVLKRAQALKAGKIRFFQDVLSLDPGDRWEKKIYLHIDELDLFLLFWSQAAKDSKWVIQETEYALQRQRESAEGLPDIVPIILEGPPPVPPPDSLRNIHFNDVIHYLIAAPRKGLLSKLFGRVTRRRAALQ